MQGCDLCLLEPVRAPQRVQPGAEQGFVGVDVAQPGDDRLVKQQRFELPRAAAQFSIQARDREAAGEGLDADAGGRPRQIARVHQTSELARVAEQQPAAVVQVPD